MNRSAKAVLSKLYDPETVTYNEVSKAETDETGFGNGTGIIIVARTSSGCIFGSSCLGEFRKKSEKVGEEAAKQLITNIKLGGCVDEYAQDQIIIFMALAKGRSTVKTGPLTSHTHTSIHFTQLMTGVKFSVTKVPDEKRRNQEDSYIIECDGIGYSNPSFG